MRVVIRVTLITYVESFGKENTDMKNVPRVPDGSSEELIAILIPVFNDWESLSRLLSEIDATLGASKMRARITLVDDGSTEQVPEELRSLSYNQLTMIEVVHLVCNLGHQRAIAVGLVHLSKREVGAKYIVVMDADGQDRPEDIPRLIAELKSQECKVVFASRSKRSEEYAFRIMYHVYRLIYLLLTGVSIRWGNFSVVTESALPALTARSDIWNHYAAAVVRSRIRFSTVSLPRGNRYRGESHMSYGSLVIHGLSGISVFSDIVGVRLIVLWLGITAFSSAFFGVELFGRLFAMNALLGWGTIATAGLVVFGLQGALVSLLFVLSILERRSQVKFVPLRDAGAYVDSITLFYSGIQSPPACTNLQA
jgi:glycosyltransferase involved in cell wall biosynthesis